jgi:hypothetical protein
VKNKNRSDELKAILLFSPSFAHPTIMMKNIFKDGKLGYDPDFKHVEDYRLWTLLSSIGKFGNVDQPLLKYRAHGDQVSVKYHDVQVRNGRRVREEMLRACGFNYSSAELEVHHAIGENAFITSVQLLNAIEKWLCSLKEQNQRNNKFNSEDFASMVNKFWYDSCGHGNLGLKAYSMYFGSELSKAVDHSFKDKFRLLAKCLLRRFK